jgi:hypothetical protein
VNYNIKFKGARKPSLRPSGSALLRDATVNRDLRAESVEVVSFYPQLFLNIAAADAYAVD